MSVRQSLPQGRREKKDWTSLSLYLLLTMTIRLYSSVQFIKKNNWSNYNIYIEYFS